ncbi:MAG: hypothetical protein JW940_01970 [Polyangiaceae bacterium]|nr:hypothetical protein [Polyangiaceae bacterium]
MGQISGVVPTAVVDRRAREAAATEYLAREFSADHGFASWTSPFRDFSRRVRAPAECFTSAVIGQVLTDGGLEPPYLGGLLDVVGTCINEEGFIHFFQDPSLLEADVDCTGVGHALLLESGRVYPRFVDTIDRLANNTRSDGIIQVYANAREEHEGRVDECALANALYLLFVVGRENEAEPSYELVRRTLVDEGYLCGSRYYPCPDTFLYFMSRIVRDFPRTHAELLELLRRRLIDRFGTDTSCLDRAIRVAAADNVGVLDIPDLEVVAQAQRPDGSWAAAPFFCFGESQRYLGSEALSTAFAVRALVVGGEKGIEEMREAMRRGERGGIRWGANDGERGERRVAEGWESGRLNPTT